MFFFHFVDYWKDLWIFFKFVMKFLILELFGMQDQVFYFLMGSRHDNLETMSLNL